MPNYLKIEPLTKAAFEPFGDLIEMDFAKSYLINEGTTRRYHHLSEPDVGEEGGRPIISIFEATRRGLPIEIKMMEKHPLGTQAFLPASNDYWLVVVSEAETPTAETLRCFLVKGNQGVQYGKHVWHHPVLCIQPKQNFWIFDREGDGNNLVEHYFDNGNAYINIDHLT